MDNFKSIYVKYGDREDLLKAIKTVMATYDMRLVEHSGNNYKFVRDRSYSRSFSINPPVNGWILVRDEDDVQAESLSQEISEILKTSVFCIGIRKDLLYYTAYHGGRQIDQYLSTFDYYEYAIDDTVIEKYRGSASTLSSIVSDKEKFERALDWCKNGQMTAIEAYTLILEAMEIRKEKEEPTEELIKEEENEIVGEGEEVSINLDDIFYVDFESINIETENREEVIEAIRQIADEMAYEEVPDFNEEQNKKRGFFKKILSSVTERRRLQFYISPAVKGWVTLVGEVQVFFGDEPADWNFLHLEERISEILKRDVVNVFADSERWGFALYRDGVKITEYDSSTNSPGNYDLPVREEVKGRLEALMREPADSPQDMDERLSQFCSLMGIENYRINIPMDYSEEEYTLHVLSRLPDGRAFTSLKFIQKR